MTDAPSARLAALEQQLRITCRSSHVNGRPEHVAVQYVHDALDELAALLPEVQKLEQENRELSRNRTDNMSDDTAEKCEGCGQPATHHDSDDVPLCLECFEACPVVVAAETDAGNVTERAEVLRAQWESAKEQRDAERARAEKAEADVQRLEQELKKMLACLKRSAEDRIALEAQVATLTAELQDARTAGRDLPMIDLLRVFESPVSSRIPSPQDVLVQILELTAELSRRRSPDDTRSDELKREKP